MAELPDNQIVAASQLATTAHAGQLYGPPGNQLPYTWHVEHVAKLAEQLGYPDEVIAAGWLHDVVEDTSLSTDDLLANGFNELVVSAVAAVTFRKGVDADKIGMAKADMLGHVVKYCDASVNFSASAIFGPKRTGRQAEALDKYLSYITELKQDLPTVKQVKDKVNKWHEKND